MGICNLTDLYAYYQMKMNIFYLIFLCTYALCENEENRSNHTKALSVFTVVRFPNEVCTSSTSGRNGTCYTSSECTSRGGSSSGSCASSFGVCCVFEKSCGAGSVAENCTYFTSSSRSAGSSCTLTICKTGSDVCQIRLDFEAFTLTGPNTATATAAAAVVAAITPAPFGNCDTDFFTVSAPGATAPPLICGENSGHHLYVPASDQCNVLTSYFGTATTSTTSAFTIKVTQVKCNSKRQAPENCLQYLTSAQGQFETFNYQTGAGAHLANQDYCICIRADRTSCTVCYATESAAIGPAATATQNSQSLGLGGGAALDHVDTFCGFPSMLVVGGTKNMRATFDYFDHITIPNGQCAVFAPGITDDFISVDRYCGTTLSCVKSVTNKAYTLALAAAQAALNAVLGTVCSSTKPFQVCVKTDSVESQLAGAATSEIQTDAIAAATGYRGFRMNYWQVSSCLLRS